MFLIIPTQNQQSPIQPKPVKRGLPYFGMANEAKDVFCGSQALKKRRRHTDQVIGTAEVPEELSRKVRKTIEAHAQVLSRELHHMLTPKIPVAERSSELSEQLDQKGLLLLQLGANPNMSDPQGNSLLSLAAKQNSTQIQKSLLHCGATPNCTDNQGVPAFSDAVKHGNEEAMGAYLKKGYLPKITGPLISAVEGQHVGTIKKLLKLDVYKNCAAIRTAMLHKILSLQTQTPQCIQVARALVDDEAFQINRRDDRNKTLLRNLLAFEGDASDDHLVIFQRLLKAGVTLSNQEAKQGYPGLLHQMLSHPLCNDDNPGRLALLKMLLHSKGLNLKNDKTLAHELLTLAVSQGSPKNVNVIKALLKAGADPKGKTTHEQFSALHHAASEKKFNRLAIQQLFKAGADINERDGTQKTPLYWAVAEAGLDCSEGFIANCEALIDLGADPNLKDKFGETALHRCLKQSSFYRAPVLKKNLALKLIRAGADIHAKNILNKSPLDLLRTTGHTELANELEAFYTDIKRT